MEAEVVQITTTGPRERQGRASQKENTHVELSESGREGKLRQNGQTKRMRNLTKIKERKKTALGKKSGGRASSALEFTEGKRLGRRQKKINGQKRKLRKQAGEGRSNKVGGEG